MQVPSIRQSGGIFEIFVPGLFLLLHILALLVISHLDFFSAIPTAQNESGMVSSIEKLGLMIIVFICFAYLIGMILRLFHARSVDLVSGYVNSHEKIRNPDIAGLLASLHYFNNYGIHPIYTGKMVRPICRLEPQIVVRQKRFGAVGPGKLSLHKFHAE